MFETAVIIILSALLALREVLHHKERKDMLDRLMARNFIEYKDNEKLEQNKLEPEKDETVDLVDAKKELYGEEELD
jgi:hypothetical protein